MAHAPCCVEQASLRENFINKLFLAWLSCALAVTLGGQALPAQAQSAVYNFSPVNQYDINLTAAYWNPIIAYLSEKSGVKLNIEAVRFPLVETIEETLKTLRNRAVQKGLVLESSLQPGFPIDVLGDPVRLRQVLTNLCDNAIKFTGQGGVYVVVLGLQAMLFQAAWVASEGQKKARRSDGLFIMGVI
jgi:hypothetical protein